MPWGSRGGTEVRVPPRGGGGGTEVWVPPPPPPPRGGGGGGTEVRVPPRGGGGGTEVRVPPGGEVWVPHPPGGVPRSGYPPRGGYSGYPPPGGGSTEGVLTTRRAVCLLRSRRRTFLYWRYFSSDKNTSSETDCMCFLASKVSFCLPDSTTAYESTLPH